MAEVPPSPARSAPHTPHGDSQHGTGACAGFKQASMHKRQRITRRSPPPTPRTPQKRALAPPIVRSLFMSGGEGTGGASGSAALAIDARRAHLQHACDDTFTAHSGANNSNPMRGGESASSGAAAVTPQSAARDGSVGSMTPSRRAVNSNPFSPFPSPMVGPRDGGDVAAPSAEPGTRSPRTGLGHRLSRPTPPSALAPAPRAVSLFLTSPKRAGIAPPKLPPCLSLPSSVSDGSAGASPVRCRAMSMGSSLSLSPALAAASMGTSVGGVEVQPVTVLELNVATSVAPTPAVAASRPTHATVDTDAPTARTEPRASERRRTSLSSIGSTVTRAQSVSPRASALPARRPASRVGHNSDWPTMRPATPTAASPSNSVVSRRLTFAVDAPWAAGDHAMSLPSPLNAPVQLLANGDRAAGVSPATRRPVFSFAMHQDDVEEGGDSPMHRGGSAGSGDELEDGWSTDDDMLLYPATPERPGGGADSAESGRMSRMGGPGLHSTERPRAPALARSPGSPGSVSRQRTAAGVHRKCGRHGDGNSGDEEEEMAALSHGDPDSPLSDRRSPRPLATNAGGSDAGSHMGGASTGDASDDGSRPGGASVGRQSTISGRSTLSAAAGARFMPPLAPPRLHRDSLARLGELGLARPTRGQLAGSKRARPFPSFESDGEDAELTRTGRLVTTMSCDSGDGTRVVPAAAARGPTRTSPCPMQESRGSPPAGCGPSRPPTSLDLTPPRAAARRARPALPPSGAAPARLCAPWLHGDSGCVVSPMAAARSLSARHPAAQEEAEAEDRRGYFESEFEIVDSIAKGSFGTVYKCLNRLDGILYAVKKSQKRYRNASERRHMLQEVFAMAAACEQTSCPHLLRYYHAWEEDHHLYIQTELCDFSAEDMMLSAEQRAEYGIDDAADSDDEGARAPVADIPAARISLTQVERRGRASQALLLKFLRHALRGLCALHATNIAHLDVKPANILYRNGVFKLGDLGLANRADQVTGDVEEGDARYLPMELLQGHALSLPASDMFSLGASAYELARGIPLPARGREWRELRERGMNRALVPHLTGAMCDLLDRMLARDVSKRPKAGEVLRSPLLATRMEAALAQERERSNEYLRQLQALQRQLAFTTLRGSSSASRSPSPTVSAAGSGAAAAAVSSSRGGLGGVSLSIRVPTPRHDVVDTACTPAPVTPHMWAGSPSPTNLIIGTATGAGAGTSGAGARGLRGPSPRHLSGPSPRHLGGSSPALDGSIRGVSPRHAGAASTLEAVQEHAVAPVALRARTSRRLSDALPSDLDGGAMPPPVPRRQRSGLSAARTGTGRSRPRPMPRRPAQASARGSGGVSPPTMRRTMTM